jgi:hypothetical protein
MNDLMILFALALVVLYAAYYAQMAQVSNLQGVESFMDFMSKSRKNDPDLALAPFQQDLPLTDFLMKNTGLTTLSAVSCAAADQARQLEPGGQYVQRTNNYRRDYPDHCSSLQSDFVGGFYEPKAGAVGSVVPCAGYYC